MSKIWRIRETNEQLQKKFVTELNILPLTAQLLINRGLVDTDKAISFLRPDIANLHDPFLMKDMQKAVERLEKAHLKGEKVAICGDYDVDGTTATALLKLFLAELGFTTLTHIPERISEGYGLSNNALQKLRSQGVSLVITTDCGVSNYDETVFANSIGIDLIITDHHELPPDIPPALAILNPKQHDCAFPFKGLAGVGVAFNLVMALRIHFRQRGLITEASQPNLKRYLDLVCIGTVADMVPLVDENRILVKYGLEELRATEKPGLKALMAVSLVKEYRLNTEKISFQIAPRINAAGRVSRADIALDLLTTPDIDRAKALADELDSINSERRFLEADITEQALAMIDPDSKDRAIVLYSQDWHPGVIGIVASKLSNRFTKPTVMIAVDGDIGRGSARGGVHNFDLLSAIKDCDKFLEKYGGHRAAAGLSIHKDNIEDFKKAFISLLNETITEDDLIPKIDIDAVISLDELNMRMVSEIERLSPFGMANREPLLGAFDTNMLHTEVVGQRHLKLQVKHKGKPLRGIAFGLADMHPIKGYGFDIAFSPFLDIWKGRKTLTIKVRDLKNAMS